MINVLLKIKSPGKSSSFPVSDGIKKNRGMTLIELVVVLSIYSLMTAVLLYNYKGFQATVDIKNLASDIALNAVQAQKASLAGVLPPIAQRALITSTWKPSYGIYVNPVSDNKSFIYFTDLNQNGNLDDLACAGSGECLSKIVITKGNSISSVDVFYQGGTSAALSDLTVSFKRPNSGAIIKSSTTFTDTVSYVQLTILSPQSPTAKIKIYPSGRIQIN